METQATIVVKDQRKVEKEGKKTFWVLVGDDGIEYTTFDGQVVDKCPVGSTIEAKVKTSKVGDKTYFNLTELIRSSAPATPPGQPSTPPPIPPGNALTPEMVSQITQLFKSFMMFGPGTNGHQSKNDWAERDAHITRQAMIRCACMNGASGDDAIILAEHYYKYIMRGSEYAEQASARIREYGREPDASIMWIANGSENHQPASEPSQPEQPSADIETDWTRFYEVAKGLGFEKPSDVTKALGVKNMAEWSESKEAALDFLGDLVGINWRTGEVASAVS